MAEKLRYDPNTGDCTNCHKDQKTPVTPKKQVASDPHKSFSEWDKSRKPKK